MDVRLSSEQEAMRDSIAQIVERLGPTTVLDLENAERAAKLDAAIDQTGVREMRIAESSGAPLTTAVEPALVAEVLAKGAADAPFLGPTLAVELRRIARAPAAGGLETVAFAGDLGSPAIVDGEAVPARTVAVDAASAQTALLLIPAPSGYRLATAKVAGPSGNSGVTAGIDLTRPTVLLDPAAVTPIDGASLITEQQLTAWKAFGLALASAELVGIMDGAITLTRDYAVGRSQYGAPIGSYQAVQHMLADAFVLLEGARSAALHAAWAVDAKPPAEALTAAAIAKAYAARSAQEVMESCIQVHGGNGNTWEYLPHVYLRRSMVASDLLGGVGASLSQIMSAYQIGA
jgi:hypothetical protein